MIAMMTRFLNETRPHLLFGFSMDTLSLPAHDQAIEISSCKEPEHLLPCAHTPPSPSAAHSQDAPAPRMSPGTGLSSFRGPHAEEADARHRPDKGDQPGLIFVVFAVILHFPRSVGAVDSGRQIVDLPNMPRLGDKDTPDETKTRGTDDQTYNLFAFSG